MKKYIIWNVEKRKIEYLSQKEKEIVQSLPIWKKYYIILAEEVKE
jgi:hypothetical protein